MTALGPWRCPLAWRASGHCPLASPTGGTCPQAVSSGRARCAGVPSGSAPWPGPAVASCPVAAASPRGRAGAWAVACVLSPARSRLARPQSSPLMEAWHLARWHCCWGTGGPGCSARTRLVSFRLSCLVWVGEILKRMQLLIGGYGQTGRIDLRMMWGVCADVCSMQCVCVCTCWCVMT